MMGRRAAKIAKVKGREDAKRGKAFARIGKKIIMVGMQGGVRFLEASAGLDEERTFRDPHALTCDHFAGSSALVHLLLWLCSRAVATLIKLPWN